MTTLADLTPEQRAECVGMWCYIFDFDCESELPVAEGIIAGYRETGNAQPLAVVAYPGQDTEKWRYTLSEVSPRFDLPRAWNPDGTPVPGEWADGHMWWGEDTDTMQTVDLVGAECLTTGQIQGLGEWPEGVTPGEDVPVRRFISEWEDA